MDPGYYWREHLMNPDGTGILVRGYYRGGWRIGMHKGQYRALVQNKPVKLYRDKNRDLVLDRDPSTIQEGMFGVNIHKAGANSTQVDKWSAACSVIQSLDQWNDFMKWIDKSAAKYGPVFSRAAFDESDVFPFARAALDESD